MAKSTMVSNPCFESIFHMPLPSVFRTVPSGIWVIPEICGLENIDWNAINEVFIKEDKFIE